MNKQDDEHETARLRWRAEELAKMRVVRSMEKTEAISPHELQQTLHELHVHQIELEMQNEELRRIHFELNSAKKKYFDLYNLAPVGYCILSSDGLILEANLTATNLLHIARAGLIAQPITRLILKEDQDIYYLHRRRFLETGESDSCELRMMKKDGSTFWASLMATTAQDSEASESENQGQIPSRLVLTDITERKHLEEVKDQLEALLSSGKKHHLSSFKRMRGKDGSSGTK